MATEEKKIPRTFAAGFVPADVYKDTYESPYPSYSYGTPFDGDLSTLLRHKKFEWVAARLEAMYLEEVYAVG